MNLLLYLSDFVFGLAEMMLVLRLVLRLMGANATAPFVMWVYDTTKPLLAPFVGIFPATAVEGRFSLDFTTLFAILIFALANALLTHLINMFEVVRMESRKRRSE